WSKGSATLEVVQRSVYWAPNHAHNGMLEVLLDLGLIGLILLGMVWAITFIRAVRLALNGSSIEDRWPLMYVVFYTLWIIPEAAALGAAQINFVLLVAVFSYLIIRGPERVRYFADDRIGQYIGLTSVER